jgi:Uma2 family endonuclease
MAPLAGYTYADLERFPEDLVRREIIGGELFVTPSPATLHQIAVGRIYSAFEAFADRARGCAFGAPVDVCFGDRDVVAPDVLYITNDRLSIIEEKRIRGAPTIVVEVLSPSTARTDRFRKRALFARYGVPEYWIVDTKARTVERLTEPRDGDYTASETFAEIVRSSAVPGLEVALDRVFAGPPPPQ